MPTRNSILWMVSCGAQLKEEGRICKIEIILNKLSGIYTCYIITIILSLKKFMLKPIFVKLIDRIYLRISESISCIKRKPLTKCFLF